MCLCLSCCPPPPMNALMGLEKGGRLGVSHLLWLKKLVFFHLWPSLYWFPSASQVPSLWACKCYSRNRGSLHLLSLVSPLLLEVPAVPSFFCMSYQPSLLFFFSSFLVFFSARFPECSMGASGPKRFFILLVLQKPWAQSATEFQPLLHGASLRVDLLVVLQAVWAGRKVLSCKTRALSAFCIIYLGFFLCPSLPVC